MENIFYPSWIIEHPVLSFLILLVEYVVIMTLYHKTNKAGSKIAKVLMIPFVVQDALVNVFALSILFLERPHEWLVTSRLKRWKVLPESRGRFGNIRTKFAWRMCALLNRFDAGHC